jgi:hypothetical protein
MATVLAEGAMTAKLFFSSCFEDPDGTRLNIRDRVINELNPRFVRSDAKQVDRLPIWVAESHALLDRDSVASPLEKALFCVEGVKDSDVYVAVAQSKHGSGVQISATEKAQASYFELELFEAALLQKPAYVFLLKGAEPTPRLKALLDLLAPALPGFCREPLTEDQVLRRTADILERQSRPKFLSALTAVTASGKRMADQLTGSRHRSYDPARELPNIEFLGGMSDPTAKPPTNSLVEDLLDRADNEPNYQTKLVLLWLAVRELMGAPTTDPSSAPFLPLWDETLSAWTSAGAWYSLHGHPLMGCLASLASLSRVRQQKTGLLDAPHGALSSEYYSIAKRVGSPVLRQTMLQTSLKHMEVAFLKMETSGNFAQRGSVRRALGDKAGAIADYEKTLTLRENHEAATPAQIGDAMTELGFALVLDGQRRRGVKYLENGVSLLEGSRPTGFLVRALRKLGRGYFLTGSPRLALATLARAHELAVQLDMRDQIGSLERTSARIERYRH